MNTLLSSEVNADEKKRVLKDEFNIAITEELESEVSEMCNLSQSVREKGKIETILELVAEGLLSIADAAKKLGISEDDFHKRYPSVKCC